MSDSQVGAAFFLAGAGKDFKTNLSTAVLEIGTILPTTVTFASNTTVTINAAPSVETDAVNKQYVDSQLSNLTSSITSLIDLKGSFVKQLSMKRFG
jgi:hypothetical protein